MFNHYHYFIVLAEECNISRAAERLYITHQNLSRYLAKLEEEFGVTLFDRKPSLSLTHAGQLMLSALKETEQREKNLIAQYTDLKNELRGEIRLGTTEGRFRILMPDIVSEFRKLFPEVQLLISSAASPTLRQMVQENRLDLMVAGVPQEEQGDLEYTKVLDERLYLVVSDNMLRSCFGEQFSVYRRELKKGADIRLFSKLPFAVNLPKLNSSILLKRHMARMGVSLNIVHSSSHPDLHHIMSSRDFAASFCLTMYLPSIMKLNRELENKLNIFPIQELRDTNPVAICCQKNRIFPRYTRVLMQLLQKQCSAFARYDAVVAGEE